MDAQTRLALADCGKFANMSRLSEGGEKLGTIRDKLSRLREARFAGREREIEVVRAMLSGKTDRQIGFVHGPGGMGKTTFLDACLRLPEARMFRTITIDARDLEPTPAGIEEAMSSQRGAHSLSGRDRLLVVIDTLERLASLEFWLFDQFIPTLPEDSIVLLASRLPPSRAVLRDIGWHQMVTEIALAGLSIDEARALLVAQGVDAGLIDPLYRVSAGNPLVLALGVDHLRRGAALPLDIAGEQKRVMTSLIGYLLEDLPSHRHRTALQVLASARIVDREMLAAICGDRDAGTLYQWLSSLPFVEQGTTGLVPHDLARDALQALCLDPRPEETEDLRMRLMMHVHRAMVRHGSAARRALSRDFVFLAKTTTLGRFLDWDSFTSQYVDRYDPSLRDVIISMTQQALGTQHAEIAGHWLDQQPEGFSVVRAPSGDVEGFWLLLDLLKVRDRDGNTDPLATRLRNIAEQEAKPVDGDLALAFRLCLYEASYAIPNPSFDHASHAAALLWSTEPRLVWSAVCSPEPDRLAPLFHSMSRFHWHQRLESAEMEFEGGAIGTYRRNWREEPNPLWHVLSERPAKPMLAREQLTEGVRQALKNFRRDDRLLQNKLLCQSNTGAAPVYASADALRRHLLTAIDALSSDPRDARFMLALRKTWIEPGAPQELVAEELGLPFNTYRYQLNRGLERVVDWLIQNDKGPVKPGLDP